MADYAELTNALIRGDAAAVTGLVRSALEGGAPAQEILNEGLIKGMDVVGDKMQSGDMFIPEVLMSAKTMAAAVEILKPLLGEEAEGAAGKVVIGTVKGDLHDIGKNLVKLMMESAGLKVTDLGVDVAPEKFVDTLKASGAGILALSALLTTTMPMMRQTLDAVTESGLRTAVKVMVGGAPVTQKFADEIGADGYGKDAVAAAQLARKFTGKQK